jgi:hypothetical protein
MISPVSAISTYNPADAPKPATQPKSTASQQTELPQDTVHLSSAAKAAAGDVDHDGDSH